MKKLKYRIVKVKGVQTISVVDAEGDPHITDEDNPNWEKIVAEARKADPDLETILNLIEPIKEVEIKFMRLSDRLTVRNRNVFWDGDVVDHSLAEQIIRFLEEDLDFAPLVKFYDKISQNPDRHSQEMLFNWLRKFKFAITADGDIVGYKGYRGVSTGYESTSSGHAFVNDEEFGSETDRTKHRPIPCKDGDIVTMPRHEVVHNPQSECAAGLHIGTPSYARKFGDTRVAILINPRDVVSVPANEGEKMRVCRYYVLGKSDSDVVTALLKDAPKWETIKPAKQTAKPQEKLRETATKAKPGDAKPAPSKPTPQPESSILEDEKPKTPKKGAPRKTTSRRTPAPAAPAPAGKAAHIDWTPKNIAKLLACKDKAEMMKAFPGANPKTLMTKAAAERRKQKNG